MKKLETYICWLHTVYLHETQTGARDILRVVSLRPTFRIEVVMRSHACRTDIRTDKKTESRDRSRESHR